jgi:outer membrane lipoprotein LolB
VNRAAVAWLLAATLVGCASTPPTPEADLITGRMSLQLDGDGTQPVRSVGADFELRGDARQGALALSSPLGTTLAQASWRPGTAELVTGRGVERFADLDELAQRMLGESLPLAALFDWLRARPWPAVPSAPTDTGFEQLGWRVDLARHGEGIVVVHRPQPPAVTLRILLDRSS